MANRKQRYTASILVNLDPATKELLTQIADNNGSSVNHLVRRAIVAYLSTAKVN